MRKIYFFILILILILSCKREQPSISESKNSCIVKMFEGNVKILDNNGNSIKIEVGLNLEENWTIKTEKDSLVELEIGNLQNIIIKENSSISIAKLFKKDSQENSSIRLISGVIVTDSKKLTSGSSFEIETKSITVGIRGTKFSVAKEEGETKVLVAEGEVKVKKNFSVESELKEIEEKDENLGKELKESIEDEVIVKENEKLEITERELEQEEKEIKESLNSVKGKLRKSEKIDSNDIKNIKNRKRYYRKNRIKDEDKERYFNKRVLKEKLKEKKREKQEEKTKENNNQLKNNKKDRILLGEIKFEDFFIVDEIEVNNQKFSKIVFITESNDVLFNRVRIIYSDKTDTVFSKNFTISKENNSRGILLIDNSKEVVKIKFTITCKNRITDVTRVFVYGIE